MNQETVDEILERNDRINNIYTECIKCEKVNYCRHFHGGNEDTFDFEICRECERKLFRSFGINLENE